MCRGAPHNVTLCLYFIEYLNQIVLNGQSFSIEEGNVQWFLIALSFSAFGEMPRVAVRDAGNGPVAMVACELEVEVHQSLGTVPQDLNFFEQPHLHCIDTPRLCSLRAVTVVAADRDPEAITARQHYCPE